MLSETALRVLDRHAAEAGTERAADGTVRAFVDGKRVEQWEGASSVYYAATRRLWVHNHTERKQSYQELYFHARDAVCATLTCSHPLKFWDLRRCASARETARVQGFPDAFVLPRRRFVFLFGNAVAVPCAAHALTRVVDGDAPLRHLDLCAGIGGFACALRAVAPAATCVGYSEILPAAVACYARNFPDAPALGDARAVRAWPAADLVTAGFPCQPFSTANTNIAAPDEHARVDFYKVVLEAVRASGATRVVLENVPQLLTQGARWALLTDALDALGFARTHAVLDAAEFGVPQRRRRLYLAARRDGVAPRPMDAYVPAAPVTLEAVLETA